VVGLCPCTYMHFMQMTHSHGGLYLRSQMYMRGHVGTLGLLGAEMTDWRLISFQSPYSSLLNRQTDRDLFCHRNAADFKSLHSLTTPITPYSQWRTSGSRAISLKLHVVKINLVLCRHETLRILPSSAALKSLEDLGRLTHGRFMKH
jgi:hypothetical protein